MRLISLMASVLILFSSMPSSAADWFEYNNRTDSFAVSLPAQPTVKDITYTSEYKHVLPGRVYTAMNGGERFEITVVDYRNLQKMENDRIKACEAANADKGKVQSRKSVPGDVCMDIYMHDMRGAVIFATWNLTKAAMDKGAKISRMAYSRMDLVEGQEVYLTNADKSQSIFGVYMHEDRLYIVEGTVAANSPPPMLFYESIGFLDANGQRIRYATPYANGLTHPARAGGGGGNRGQQPQ
jgi:hypothetical protein